MKYTKVYISGNEYKEDSTDYVDYYRAENGMVIAIDEVINTNYRFYSVYSSEEGYKNKDKSALIFSYPTLKQAKAFIEEA